MSGGGDGGIYIPPARKKTALSCEMLEVETTLTKPEEEQLVTLAVGQILTVHVQERRVYVMFGDQIVGDVEAPENNRIIECVEAGTFYVAEILELTGAICKVKIYAPQL